MAMDRFRLLWECCWLPWCASVFIGLKNIRVYALYNFQAFLIKPFLQYDYLMITYLLNNSGPPKALVSFQQLIYVHIYLLNFVAYFSSPSAFWYICSMAMWANQVSRDKIRRPSGQYLREECQYRVGFAVVKNKQTRKNKQRNKRTKHSPKVSVF